ncbi:MAG: hypothetical protein RLZZ24_546 [Pseudomonadota bacterium]
MTLLGPEGIHSIQPMLPVQLEVRQIYVQAPIAKQLGLVDGQVVQALVAAQPDQLHLNLKGHIFQMPLSPYIKDGDMAQLRAQMLANGEWSLQLLHSGRFAGPEQQQAAQALNPTRLRALLFQPSGFANWLSLLEPGAMAALAPPESRATLQTLLRQQRLFMSSLQPQTLKRWMMPHLRPSEARLAQEQPVQLDEPKTLLRWLLAERDNAQMDDAPTTQALRAALDEVESSQVKASQDWQRGDINLNLVLPFADAAPMEMHIEREAQRPGQPPNPLIINMHTQSQSLGEVWLKTTITPQAAHRQIDLTMWALRSDVAALAMSQTTALTDELENAGLVMGGFQVFNGARPDVRSAPAPSAHGILVDARA